MINNIILWCFIYSFGIMMQLFRRYADTYWPSSKPIYNFLAIVDRNNAKLLDGYFLWCVLWRIFHSHVALWHLFILLQFYLWVHFRWSYSWVFSIFKDVITRSSLASFNYFLAARQNLLNWKIDILDIICSARHFYSLYGWKQIRNTALFGLKKWRSYTSPI